MSSSAVGVRSSYITLKPVVMLLQLPCRQGAYPSTYPAEEEQVLHDGEVEKKHIVLWTQPKLLPGLLQVCSDVPAAHFSLAPAWRVNSCRTEVVVIVPRIRNTGLTS